MDRDEFFKYLGWVADICTVWFTINYIGGKLEFPISRQFQELSGISEKWWIIIGIISFIVALCSCLVRRNLKNSKKRRKKK